MNRIDGSEIGEPLTGIEGDTKLKELTIVIPYRKAGIFYRLWAESENEIDFRRDFFTARRCTMCFGAIELKNFLTRTDRTMEVMISGSIPSKGFFIELKIEEKDTGGGYKISPGDRGIVISGHDRNGLLNGVYDFLRSQGWMWTEPGQAGECRPRSRGVALPRVEQEANPSFKYRCLDAFRESHDSVEYLLWMARNRLNTCFRKQASGKFADKLGLLSRAGGHLLSKIADPDKPLENGSTLWDEHPEWYGSSPGEKKRRHTAARVQLCASQPKLMSYIADETARLLQGPLADVDILDLWGFDTGGKTCACDNCKSKGNGADMNLLMLSCVRERLDKDFADGKLCRRVIINTAAYEGTGSLEGPTKKIPENLVESGDACIFYPIKRCYRHKINEPGCTVNSRYTSALLSWNPENPGLIIWTGEYYNLSKYEDLPLLFTSKIPADMRFYHSKGVRGATYMHAVSVNWAMRSLTQMQHSQYAWDVQTDDHGFLECYFKARYGRHSSGMRKVYELIEDAMSDIASWRNWGSDNFLGRLNSWDGQIPENELVFGHYASSAEALKSARRSIKQLNSASRILGRLLAEEKSVNWENFLTPDHDAVNPEELEACEKFDLIEHRIGESKRMLVYGVDMMRIMLQILKYHDSLHKKDLSAADSLWQEVEAIASKMETYFLPIKFENPGPGIVSPDALTRTQLRGVIARCRGARSKGLSG